MMRSTDYDEPNWCETCLVSHWEDPCERCKNPSISRVPHFDRRNAVLDKIGYTAGYTFYIALKTLFSALYVSSTPCIFCGKHNVVASRIEHYHKEGCLHGFLQSI
jgi:hypothetical protein